MNYRKEIDGLRAIAVLSVIFYHAGFATFSGGYIGVDVFFVISGFLITSIIKNSIYAGEFSFIEFYERRMRRIFPALFLVMLCCIPFAWLILLPYDLRDFFESIFAIPVFMVNHLFLNESGYFSSPAENKPLLNTWSLSVEEQYYLIFPLILSYLLRTKIKLAPVFVIAILIVLSFSLSVWYTKYKPDLAYFTLPTRAWEFLIGAAAVFINIDKFNFSHSKKIKNMFSMIGLSLILGVTLFYDKNTAFPGLNALFPVLGAILIILFANEQTLVGRILTSKIFVGIGLISYSAYLWHQPVFAFYRYQTIGEPNNVILISLIAIVFIISFLSWKYIENYFRNKRNFSRKAIFVLSSIGILFFISIGLIGHFTDPLKIATMRFNEEKLATIRSVAHSPYRNQCHFEQSDKSLSKTPCTYFGGEISVAVVGNSHATELAYSLAIKLQPMNIGVVHHTMSGCTHNYKIKEEVGSVCGRWHEKVFQMIMDNKSIKTVILSYRNEKSLTEEKYRISLAKFANELVGAGRRVILVLQAPMPLMHINQHLSSAMPDLSGSIASRKLSDWRVMYASSADLLKLLRKDIQIVDPSNLFCDNDYCYVTKNGVALFFDDDHISLSGAKIIIDQFFGVFQLH